MAESPPEYVVRDYSAIDKQIEEVARRERTLTDRMKLQNLGKLAIIIGGLALVAGLVFLLISWGIRIMNPPKIIYEDRPQINNTNQNDRDDIKNILENEKKTESKRLEENKIIIQNEKILISELNEENQELEKQIKNIEKNTNIEIRELEKNKEILKDEITKKYEVEERILKEKIINEEEKLKNLESQNAPEEDIKIVKERMSELNEESIKIGEKKQQDIKKKSEQLDEAIKKKNQILNDTKKGIRKKITNNESAIAKAERNIEKKNQEIANVAENNDIKRDIIIFKSVDIKDNLFEAILTRHAYESADLERPSSESCYAERKGKQGVSESLELALKKNNRVQTLFMKSNAYNLNRAQWNTYSNYCRWFY